MTHDDDDDDDGDDNDDDDDDDHHHHHHDADRFKLGMICWSAIFCQVESDTRRPWLGDIRLGA